MYSSASGNAIRRLIESNGKGFKKLLASAWILCVAIYLLDMYAGYVPGMNILKVLVFVAASFMSGLVLYAPRVLTSNEDDFCQMEEDCEPQYQNPLLRVLVVAMALGASVLLIGALFRVMRWPSANMLLNIGAFTCGAQFAGLFIFIRDEFERKGLMKWSLACMLLGLFFYGINYQNLHSQIKYRDYPALSEAYRLAGENPQSLENSARLRYETNMYLIENSDRGYKVVSEEVLAKYKAAYQEFLDNPTQENYEKFMYDTIVPVELRQ